jgi:hypothetical protein
MPIYQFRLPTIKWSVTHKLSSPVDDVVQHTLPFFLPVSTPRPAVVSSRELRRPQEPPGRAAARELCWSWASLASLAPTVGWISSEEGPPLEEPLAEGVDAAGWRA